MKIVTLTLSAAYDIHCSGEKIESGKENFVSLLSKDAGGKGINISRALNEFGVDSFPIAVLGDENSKEFYELLEKEGLKVEVISVPGRIRENITVHTEDGKETRISLGASEVPQNLIELVEKITDGILENGDILTFTGSIPGGVDIGVAVAYLKRQAEKGVRVIVDSRSLTLSDIVEIKPFLIKPNEYEIIDYIGSEIFDIESAIRSAEQIRRLGVGNVMITLGGRGAVISSAEGSFYSSAPDVEVKSTIGAGDSSIAGFVYALINGESVESALKISVAFGSAACLTEGTHPPQKENVFKIIKNGIL